MITLGIESTAHTFGIGIVQDNKVIANKKRLFTTKKGGMIPFQVQEHHVEICQEVLKEALAEANLSMKDVDVIAFSQGPGMGHTLRVGSMAARTLSYLHNKPIVGVNHCIAHLTIGEKLGKAEDGILLYVSGANTQVIAYEEGRYRIFGETLDQGIGNFLDSFARELGLGFPGGPKVYELALKGKNFIELPYSVKGMDVSFGGLFSFLRNKMNEPHEDLCYSVQETVFSMMVEVAERALAYTGKKQLVLGGGVACNKRLNEMCQKMCDARGCTLHVPEPQFLLDNGAMIAMQGQVQYEASGPSKDLDVRQHERTDDIEVNWK